MKNRETLRRLGESIGIDLLARASMAGGDCMKYYRERDALDEWLERASGSDGRNALNGAFRWSDSPEGADFWAIVSTALSMPEGCSSKVAAGRIAAAAEMFKIKKLEGV